MDWFEIVVPAAIGALASLAVAVITVRTQLRAAKDRLEAEVQRRAREFTLLYAETIAKDNEHAAALRQQFAGAYLHYREAAQAPSDAESLGTGSTRSFLPCGVRLVVGCDPRCDIRLSSEDRYVSRQHALLEVEGDQGLVTDISTNGTLVNGKKIASPTWVSDGDLIVFGDVETRFRVLKPAPAGEN